MILGLDFDTRAVHAVLLNDDTNHAVYVPVPFVEHKPPFRFDDARNVREALNDAMRVASVLPGKHPWSADGWESIHLVGVEKPYAQGRGTAYTYGLITGAILATIPRAVPVLDMPPNDRDFGWKALSVGKTNASKDEVAAWAARQLPGCPDPNRIEALIDWPQDAFDAYCIARAARTLNERGLNARKEVA